MGTPELNHGEFFEEAVNDNVEVHQKVEDRRRATNVIFVDDGRFANNPYSNKPPCEEGWRAKNISLADEKRRREIKEARQRIIKMNQGIANSHAMLAQI